MEVGDEILMLKSYSYGYLENSRLAKIKLHNASLFIFVH